MAQRIGATPEQLTELKRVFDAQVGEVTRLESTISNKLGSVDWQGQAHDRFEQMWNGEFKRSLSKLREALTDAGNDAHQTGERIRQAGS